MVEPLSENSSEVNVRNTIEHIQKNPGYCASNPKRSWVLLGNIEGSPYHDLQIQSDIDLHEYEVLGDFQKMSLVDINSSKTSDEREYPCSEANSSNSLSINVGISSPKTKSELGNQCFYDSVDTKGLQQRTILRSVYSKGNSTSAAETSEESDDEHDVFCKSSSCPRYAKPNQRPFGHSEEEADDILPSEVPDGAPAVKFTEDMNWEGNSYQTSSLESDESSFEAECEISNSSDSELSSGCSQASRTTSTSEACLSRDEENSGEDCESESRESDGSESQKLRIEQPILKLKAFPQKFTIASAGYTGGCAGGFVGGCVGTAICPGLGTAAGAAVGGIAASMVAEAITKKIVRRMEEVDMSDCKKKLE